MAGMRQETAIDGFRLAYERTGAGPAVLLLHGWPGDRTDYREVAPLVSAAADVIVPDLRGFGGSDKHEADPASQYNATAQARRVIGLIGELALGPAVVAGYDIGSRIAQAIARDRPDLVRALIVAPPLPGIGDRILVPPGPGGRIAVPTTVLWPEHDPLFPREWSDRVGEFFSAARLTWLDGAGHFSPLEAPEDFAAAVITAVTG